MKKNVLIYGLISGSLITAMMVYGTILCYNNPDFEGNMLLGFAGMLVAFSFIFVGTKSYRDKHNNGLISFGQAFKVGLYISLIASTMYVLVWVIEYYTLMPDFMDKYSAHVMKEAVAKGATQAELDEKMAEMVNYKEMYKNPLLLVLITYSEVFPFALIIALLTAWFLKRKPKVITE